MAAHWRTSIPDAAGSSSEPALRLPRLTLGQKMLVFGAAFFACAQAGVLLSLATSPFMSFWLPSGLFVAVLLVNETSEWPGLVLAAMSANLFFDYLYGTPFVTLILFSFANVAQSVTGAWLVRRFVAHRPTLDNLKEFVGLLAFAAVVGAMLGATIGSLALKAGGLSNSFAQSWRIWWGSTAMAVLIFSPLILTWFCRSELQVPILQSPRRAIEAAVLYLGLLFMTWHVLDGTAKLGAPNKSPLLIFLLWAGMRFGLRGAALANFLFAIEAGFLTTRALQERGPQELLNGHDLFTMQIALAVVSMVGMIPAIVLNERDRSLTRLRASEEKFSKAFHASPNGMSITEMETGRYIDVNESLCRLYGYAKEEMIGRTTLELGMWENPADRDELIRMMRTEGQVRELLVHSRTRTGENKTLLLSAERIEVGGRPCLISVRYDITERKRAEEELRQSEEKFEKAFRSSPNGMSITEIDTGRFIEVNESMCRLYNGKKDEFVGHTSLELGMWENPADRLRVVELLRSQGRVSEMNVRGRTLSGEARTFLLSAEMIEISGNKYMLIVLYDITARLKIEESLEKSHQQLRALTSRLQNLREEERTHLAREIHDHLGQLLTALKLDLRLVERKLVASGETELRTVLNAKLASATGLTDQIITSVQKIAAELRPAILDRIGLEAAIEVEAREFQDRTGLQCTWTLPDAPLGVTPDQATAVFRIFQELLTNIARHARAASVNVRLSRQDGSLQLEVKDDGVGITREHLNAPQSLGLLGMHERAEILGGNISFGPNAGKGTAVVLQIPLNKRPAK